jgi:hypothetical protein
MFIWAKVLQTRFLPARGVSFGILESLSVCQFETIGIVIVSSASPSSGNEKLLNSLQSRLARSINKIVRYGLILPYSRLGNII